MNKSIFRILLATILIIVYSFITIDYVQAVDSTLDVHIPVDQTFKSIEIKNNKTIAQMFVPHKDYTTDIAIFLKFPNSGDITMKLFDHQNLKFFPSQILSAPESAGWMRFNLPLSDYPMTPGEHYSIQLETTSNNMAWAYDLTNPYDEGYASKASKVWLAADFGLKTFGYNEEDLVADNNLDNDNIDQAADDDEQINNNNSDDNTTDNNQDSDDQTIDIDEDYLTNNQDGQTETEDIDYKTNPTDNWKSILIFFLVIYLALITCFWIAYRKYQKLIN